MSWSIALIGKPENVAKAIEDHGQKLDGQCKVEYDAASPHLAALVRENYVANGSGHVPPIVKIEASGSGGAKGDVQTYRNCTVKIENLYNTLV